MIKGNIAVGPSAYEGIDASGGVRVGRKEVWIVGEVVIDCRLSVSVFRADWRDVRGVYVSKSVHWFVNPPAHRKTMTPYPISPWITRMFFDERMVLLYLP